MAVERCAEISTKAPNNKGCSGGEERALRQVARGMSGASVIGTLAARQRRYAGFFFAGSIKTAAAFAFRFLGGQVREIERNAWTLVNGMLSAKNPRKGRECTNGLAFG
jgi:hypothetical protein